MADSRPDVPGAPRGAARPGAPDPDRGGEISDQDAEASDQGAEVSGRDAEQSRLDEKHRQLASEYDAERPARDLPPRLGLFVSAVGVAVSLFALYWVFDPLPELQYRMAFLALVLPLVFLAYRPFTRGPFARGPLARLGGTTPGKPDRPGPADWLLAAIALVACAYPLLDYEAFVRRTFDPTTLDITMGALATVLVLEATRRTVGWILPAICVAFLLYAYYGGLLPVGATFGHRGYDWERIVTVLYVGGEGLYGVPLAVAATYIVLFTIYGAVLELSGAGRFFIDISLAAFRRSRTAAGRTVTSAGFLLGTVSGSGVATTVTLGSAGWPILRRSGYPPEQGGGVLAAAGIGAILSPPTMGAAAFIIAELLGVSYLKVLLFAAAPTLLYYLGIVLAIEIDARRHRLQGVEVDAPPAGRLLLRYGYHFSSLVAIVVLMALDMTPFRAVVLATLLAFALSFLDPANRLTPKRALQALAKGATGVLPVTATCAAAGTIVAVVVLTGLGLRMSSIIVNVAGESLLITALLAAVAVLLLGLAVPVTASFVIAAVIIAPALRSLDVPAPEAYMFIFYYAVLSEVSPPTALSSVAASAITGGNTYRTMMSTWKYSLPAFLVPFAFVLAPSGSALLGRAPIGQVLLALLVSAIAVAALAAATGGWVFGPAGPVERVLAAVAALALLYLEPTAVLVGLGALTSAIVVHLALRRRRQAVPEHTSQPTHTQESAPSTPTTGGRA